MRKKLGPDRAIIDLESYLRKFELELTSETKDVFYRAEVLGQTHNKTLFNWTFLVAALETIKPLRSAMIRLGGNPTIGVIDATKRIINDVDDPYDLDDKPYSSNEYRGLTTRTLLVDLAISIAKRNRQSEITLTNFIETLLEAHDQDFPVNENTNWTDEALDTPYNTLSHMVGSYFPSLWVRFDDLRRELSLQNVSSPAESAPPEARTAVLELLDTYPDYDKNCFIIMPFRSTPVHSQIFEVLHNTLTESGFNVLRADNNTFSDDLFINILTHMHGCKFGIAIFERVLSNEFNPNVSLEVGYMLGLRKSVLLLKDKTLPNLPTDLVGRLYYEFDTLSITETLPYSILKWLISKKLIKDNTNKI